MRTETARDVFQLASTLLLYPDDGWKRALPTLRRRVKRLEDGLPKDALLRFIAAYEQADEGEWLSTYVYTFDFGRSTNLYLTYARFGEQRERGPVLIEMKQRYRAAGWELNDSELADYLPVMLEFAAVASPEDWIPLFAPHLETIPIIEETLASGGNPYAAILEAVRLTLNMCGVQAVEAGGVHV